MSNDALPLAPSRSPLTEHDIYLFREGTHTKLHGKFGCRLDADGAHFAVWAPNAQAVSVIGEFNGWDAGAHPMSPRWDSSGVWERFVPGVRPGAAYKYRISPKGGGALDKADPFAFYAQTPPETASRAWSLEYAWGDGEWMAGRAERNGLAAPM
jgi:1,4-alpha-glucan branching enzyme